MDYVFYLFLIVTLQFRTLLQCSVFKIVDMYTTNPVLKSTLLAHSSRPLCSFTSSLGHGFAKGPTPTIESKPVCLVYSNIPSNLRLPGGWYSSANTTQEAKREWANDVLTNCNPTQIWRFTKWFAGNHKTCLPPLHKADSLFTKSEAEQQEALRQHFFPSAPPDMPIQVATNPSPLPAHSFHNITVEEVQEALKTTSNTLTQKIDQMLVTFGKI
jgi:hypothetical protein